ncbi:MAG: hypothetical protein NXI31_03995 [bacterium]|nr:hypothetical protein [bacterium]
MARRPKRVREYFACPHCGADVLAGSKACKACGSDAETGWQDEAEIEYQSLEIPDGWGPENETALPTNAGKRWWVPVIAIVVALLLFALALRVL